MGVTSRPAGQPGQKKKSDLAVLGAQMGPDRPNFKSYSHITALQPVGTVPRPFRPTFGLPGQPIGQLGGHLVGQLAVQLAGQLAGQLVVQLAGQLAGQLASGPASWLASSWLAS